MSQPQTTFYEDLYPRGFRKLLAIGIIFASSALPATYAWQHGGDAVADPADHFGVPRGFAPPPRFGPAPPAARAEGVPLRRTFFAMLGSAIGLVVYYPRRGFKRYALLCGPLIGLGTAILTTSWLTGRQHVHRAELVFAALLGGAPGALLYAWLARRKWIKLHAREEIWIE
jgi:hypothetical protein